MVLLRIRTRDGTERLECADGAGGGAAVGAGGAGGTGACAGHVGPPAARGGGDVVAARGDELAAVHSAGERRRLRGAHVAGDIDRDRATAS